MAVGEVFTSSSSGIERKWIDNGDGTYSIVATQNISAQLDYNKAAYTHNDGYSESRELRRAAFIPDIIALKWLHEEGWWYKDEANEDKLISKLNDPDYLYLRTAPGRIGQTRQI